MGKIGENLNVNKAVQNAVTAFIMSGGNPVVALSSAGASVGGDLIGGKGGDLFSQAANVASGSVAGSGSGAFNIGGAGSADALGSDQFLTGTNIPFDDFFGRKNPGDVDIAGGGVNDFFNRPKTGGGESKSGGGFSLGFDEAQTSILSKALAGLQGLGGNQSQGAGFVNHPQPVIAPAAQSPPFQLPLPANPIMPITPISFEASRVIDMDKVNKAVSEALLRGGF